MQDARINTGLPGHPKTKKLMRRLGPSGPWSLVCLFLWTAANRSNGDLSGMSDEDIELAADWNGDEGQLVQELASVGFLDGDSGAYVIHDWAEHNPWAAGAADRSEASKWAALCKRYGRDGAADRMPDYAYRMRTASDSHAPGTNPQCVPDAPLPSPLPSPKQEEPNGSSASAGADAPASKSDPIPYQAIADLFNATLTGLAKVRELTAKRRTLIRTAWHASPQRRNRKFWTAYFAECQDDPFLNGTGPYSEPHANWRPSFDYLLRADVVTRVFERAMDRIDREAA